MRSSGPAWIWITSVPLIAGKAQVGFGGCGNYVIEIHAVFMEPYANAPMPVIFWPRMRVCISSVPS